MKFIQKLWWAFWGQCPVCSQKERIMKWAIEKLELGGFVSIGDLITFLNEG